MNLFALLSRKRFKQQKTSTMSLTTSIKDIVWESWFQKKLLKTSENKKRIRDSISRVLFYFFRRTTIPTSITIPSDAMVPYADKLSSRNFLENCNRANSKSSKALHSIISLKLGLRLIYFKNDLCNLLISTIPFWSKSFIHRIKLFLRKSGLLQSF